MYFFALVLISLLIPTFEQENLCEKYKQCLTGEFVEKLINSKNQVKDVNQIGEENDELSTCNIAGILKRLKEAENDPDICRGKLLGVGDSTIISDDQLNASNWVGDNPKWHPRNARLDKPASRESVGCWLPIPDQNRPEGAGVWIQVDLLEKKYVQGVVIQGCDNYFTFVKTFKVALSEDGTDFRFLQNSKGQDKVFKGNRNWSGHARRLFRIQLARFVRIYPLSGIGTYGMRFDVIVC